MRACSQHNTNLIFNTVHFYYVENFVLRIFTILKNRWAMHFPLVIVGELSGQNRCTSGTRYRESNTHGLNITSALESWQRKQPLKQDNALHYHFYQTWNFLYIILIKEANKAGMEIRPGAFWQHPLQPYERAKHIISPAHSQGKWLLIVFQYTKIHESYTFNTKL
jgi:hypothetical protein